jgi:hypothetical protein
MKRLNKAFPRGSVSSSGMEIGNNFTGRVEVAQKKQAMGLRLNRKERRALKRQARGKGKVDA